MCGIFGWVSRGERSQGNVRKTVADAFRLLRHRGPDDHGMMFQLADGRWCEREHELRDDVPLFIGHVRLSILDLSPLGKQPMMTEDGRFRLSFNGEVYNYLELREELRSQGVRFRTDTDSEVVLQAFACWGLACLNRFSGMFAMAIHDDREKKLYLIRDHFGIKPLYYAAAKSGQCFFASELPVMLRSPAVECKADPQRIYDYLIFGDYDSQDETMVEGVLHLPPGHCMTIDTNTGEVIEQQRYWKPDLTRTSSLSFSEAAEALRELFLKNVRLHLRSDVPLGAALSGGVDSSAVTCAIRHLEPDMPLKTFTYVAAGTEVDEEAWADTVIHHVGSKAYKVRIGPRELTDDLDDLIQAQGEPFGSTSIYAQYRVFRLAREAGVTVTLDGQGADEMFAGYMGFPAERLKSLIMAGQVLEAWRFFQATSRWPDRSKADVFKRLVAQFTPACLYPALRSIGRGSVTPPWLNKDWLQEHKLRTNLPVIKEGFQSRYYVREELARQLTRRGLPALLRHGDRNSMRFSIESRVPFLTREMAAFALSLPESYLIDGTGQTKSVFKQAMRGIVPDNILDRRDKVGFATPERQWLEELRPWVEETLHEADCMPCLSKTAMLQTWQEILVGQRDFDWQTWRWLNLIRWVKTFSIRLESTP